MRFRLAFSIAVIVAFLVLLPVSLQAQNTSRELVARVNVPFDFVVGGVHLLPGEYRIFHNINPDVLLFERDDMKATALMLVNVGPTPRGDFENKLVFHRYPGEQLFCLRDVHTAGRDGQVHTSPSCNPPATMTAQGVQPEVRVIAAK